LKHFEALKYFENLQIPSQKRAFQEVSPILISKSLPAQAGQGGLIAIAVTVLVALVIMAGSLSSMSNMNATRTVVTKQTLQAFYVGQSGIQEAMATRILPRSNYLNFKTPIGAQKPMYAGSGLVYQNPDPINPTGLLGQYRYVVVGGQGTRIPGTGAYYAPGDVNPLQVPRLIVTDSIPDTSPFIVMSNASVCKSSTNVSVIQPDALIAGLNPTCKPGYYLDDITLVAQVRLNREQPSNGTVIMDRAQQLRIFKNRNAIILPAGAQVPGYAAWQPLGSTINFDTVWTSGTVKPNHLLVYNFIDNTIYVNTDITGTSMNIGTIPAKAVLRLYFNEAFDYRSISPTYDTNLTDCGVQATAANCRVRVMQGTDATGNQGTAYLGNTMIPILPDGSQLILLPPVTPADQIQSTNNYNAIKIDAKFLQTSNSSVGTQNYTIIFKTQ